MFSSNHSVIRGNSRIGDDSDCDSELWSASSSSCEREVIEVRNLAYVICVRMWYGAPGHDSCTIGDCISTHYLVIVIDISPHRDSHFDPFPGTLDIGCTWSQVIQSFKKIVSTDLTMQCTFCDFPHHKYDAHTSDSRCINQTETGVALTVIHPGSSYHN